MKCELCGKGVMVGRIHTHHPGVAGGRWKKRAPKTQKIFKPNLHSAKILIGDSMRRVRLCTKCLRIAKKSFKDSSQKVSQVIHESPGTPVQTL